MKSHGEIMKETPPKRYPSRIESRAGFFASTREECLSPRVRLECNPEIPVAPGEEHWLLDTSPDEVYWPCSHLVVPHDGPHIGGQGGASGLIQPGDEVGIPAHRLLHLSGICPQIVPQGPDHRIPEELTEHRQRSQPDRQLSHTFSTAPVAPLFFATEPPGKPSGEAPQLAHYQCANLTEYHLRGH